MLEIGIGTLIPEARWSMVGWGAPHYKPGGSLRSWRDYFPNADIMGFDVQPDTQFREERISTFICDSTDGNAVSAVIEERNFRDIDLIVDDGSHRPTDQLSTLKNCFKFLRHGGLYVIEDVGGGEIFNYKTDISEIVGKSIIFNIGLGFNPIFIIK